MLHIILTKEISYLSNLECELLKYCQKSCSRSHGNVTGLMIVGTWIDLVTATLVIPKSRTEFDRSNQGNSET